jgi:hypothetical protein
MANTTTETLKEQPYKLSWIDRFNNWVKKLPIHAWIFFVVFGIGLIVVQILFLWLGGGLQEVELLPVIIFNGLFTPFLLALIFLLDNQSATALNTLRPVLDTTESEFDQFEYKLSNMPYPRPLVAGLILLVIVILMERLLVVPARYSALEQLPIFNVVFQVTDKSSAFLFGVFIYHTIRQLLMVNTINSNHVRINLFNLGPLQAFSRLTATTAVGLIVGVYGWMLINPELLADPGIFGFAVIITILAVSIFVWPLYGVHRRMEVAKEKALQEIDLRFEEVFSKFNKGFLEEDYTEIERLNGTIASLEIQHSKIKAIPSWPWRPETAQYVLAAIALPLALSILRFLVEQAIDWLQG